MSDKNNGGAAFPPAFPDSPEDQQNVRYGMTLRDYFAAKAMQAFVANHFQAISLAADRKDSSLGSMVSGSAYEIADAMLAERAK